MHRVTVLFQRITLAMLTLLCAGLWTGLASAKGELSPAVVGQVSMVLGKAAVLSAGGRSVPATVGLPIHVSDTIETTNSGQVHIRFVDDALISVRPLSTLEIVRYDYNPQNPQNSAVKLNLVEGTTRAISGQAAKQARQNFRMNTPLAAIGVRGTDFAVSASGKSMRAIVNEGAIVVAPYSSHCSVDALGPCSKNAVELNGLSRQILEINSGTSGISSALLPATTAQAQALVAEASAKTDSDNKAGDIKELYTDTVTSRAVNTALANTDTIKNAEPPPLPPPSPLPSLPVDVPPPPPEFTPSVLEPIAALTADTQLVWGRWNVPDLTNERITVPLDVAYENDRRVSVGNLVHTLFRSEPAGKSLQSGLGVLAFNLSKAQAQFKSEGKAELMQVNGGQLSLDFNEARFSTNLQLSHPATGNITFADSGLIYYGEIFRNNSETQTTAGSISLDGKEAGYFFQKTLTNGSVEGLTLWSQKP